MIFDLHIGLLKDSTAAFFHSVCTEEVHLHPYGQDSAQAKPRELQVRPIGALGAKVKTCQECKCVCDKLHLFELPLGLGFHQWLCL